MKLEDFDGIMASFIPSDQFVSNMWEFGSKETSAAAAAITSVGAKVRPSQLLKLS